MADEALLSFQSLLQSVPGWISDLETILTTATQQQLVLAAEYATDEAARYSTHQQSSLTPLDLLRLSQRKRKTASVCSAVSSKDIDTPRRQCLATIYYDGSTQKRFEMLVRGIGSSRNLIRKGKLGMRLDNLTRTGSSSSSGSSSEGEETIKGLGTFHYRTTTTFTHSAANNKDDTAMFDAIDTALEKAQMHCERAAHQILRQGDCSVDITKARQHFEESIATINAKLPALEKRAARALQRRLAEDEKYALEEHQPTHIDGHSLLSDGALEVDTDECADSDGEDLDLTTFKMPLKLDKHTNTRVPSGVTTISI